MDDYEDLMRNAFQFVLYLLSIICDPPDISEETCTQIQQDNSLNEQACDKKLTAKLEKMFYRSAPCLGVKHCPQQGCKYVAPIRERRNLLIHPDQTISTSISQSLPF